MRTLIMLGPAVVRLPDEIDMSNAADVGQELKSALCRDATVIADMSATTFCDCMGVRALLQAQRQAAGSGGELRVAAATAPVRHLFGLLELDQLLDIHCSVKAAQAST